MAPTTNKSGPVKKKPKKFKHRSKKHRVKKRPLPNSALAVIIPKQAPSLSSQELLNQANRKPKPIENKLSSSAVDSKHPTQWPSSEPFEKVRYMLYPLHSLQIDHRTGLANPLSTELPPEKSNASQIRIRS